MLNIADPTPPLPRSTISSAKDCENPARTLLTATTAMPAAITGGQRAEHPHQREHTDHAGRGGHAHAKLAGEGGDHGGDDPEPECDGERYGGKDRHFRGQITKRASPGTTHAGHCVS
jgi:hypothetical protein